MFYYIKIAFRSLRNNRVYSVINVSGLVIGIVAATFIFLWVHNERSYDAFRPHAHRIYRITNTWNVNGSNPWTLESSPYMLAMAARHQIPEIQNLAFMSLSSEDGITVKNETFYVFRNLVYVTPEWFGMFGYKLIDGSFEPFAGNPFSVILTRSEAKKYFGDERAVGQIVNIRDHNYIVQAVVHDNPSNSIFQFGIMVPMDAYLNDPRQKENAEKWGNYDQIVFIKLQNNTDTQQICRKINELYQAQGSNTEANLVALPDIHFETGINSMYFAHGNSRMVSVFAILGLFILFTACINYVNLTTARSNMRAKETGIKKMIGARRFTLFSGFVVETFLVSLVSVIISIGFIWLLSPMFYNLTGCEIPIFTSSVTWLILGLTLLIVTILSGIYPAWMLSAFNPLKSIKGITVINIKAGSLRRGLIVFQFALSTVLLFSVLIIYQQMTYITKMDLGYNRDQVVSVETPYRKLFSQHGNNAQSTMQNVRNEVAALPGISGAALSDAGIMNIGNSRSIEGNAGWDGHHEEIPGWLKIISINSDYPELLGLKLADGRWFEEENPADRTNFILNETAVRELKIDEPVVGKRFTLSGNSGTIVGVVKDFHYESLHEKIGPLVMCNAPNYMLNFKVEAGKTAQALKEVKQVWSSFLPNTTFEYKFLDDTFNKLYQSDIRTSQLLLVFCVFTVFIAVMGLFGLSTFTIERRNKEIGIRKVLGASISVILQLITREFILLVAFAFVIAVPVSWWAMNKWLNDFAYHINITAWMFLAAAVLIILTALIAIGSQAIKAATANPVKAIKSE